MSNWQFWMALIGLITLISLHVVLVGRQERFRLFFWSVDGWVHAQLAASYDLDVISGPARNDFRPLKYRTAGDAEGARDGRGAAKVRDYVRFKHSP